MEFPKEETGAMLMKNSVLLDVEKVLNGAQFPQKVLLLQDIATGTTVMEFPKEETGAIKVNKDVSAVDSGLNGV